MMFQCGLFLSYLLSGCLFVVGIRGLSSPETAVRGNFLAMIGMALAIVVTFLILPTERQIDTLAVLGVGGIVGLFSVWKVKMTSLPQFVAMFNGLGGLASLLIGYAECLESSVHLFEISLGIVIGASSFGGSLIAFLKLSGILANGHGRTFFYNILTSLFGLMVLFFWVVFLSDGRSETAFFLGGSALLWSVLFVWPVGGADMPVMISLLNAGSGLAGASIGFSFGNVALVMTGALVGAGGLFLARVMTVAVNRSLIGILFKTQKQAPRSEPIETRFVRVGTPEEAGFILKNSQKVMIVPGYGMAVAQAQHAVRTMADLLAKKYDVSVRFAVHPVAGRMPGHMNVLLSEADVPYEDVDDLPEANEAFSTTDAVYVIGANDITNPEAEKNPSSPIYGMPILEVYKAKTVFFVKRSLATGYAGVENPLFYDERTIMLYGDATQVTEQIVRFLEKN